MSSAEPNSPSPLTGVEDRSQPENGPGIDQQTPAPRRAGRDPLVRTLIALCVLLTVIIAFLGGVWTERELVDRLGGPVDAGRLNEVAGLLDAEYYRGPTDDAEQAAFDERLEQGALVGLAEGAGDPYTSYLPPEDAAPLTEQLSGQYGGIGITVQQREGALAIVQVLAGGPAEAAGLRPDDLLIAVDGYDLTGATTEDAGVRIRGEVGTTVTLVVLRAGLVEPLTVPVERRQLDAPVVTYVLDPATRIGQIRVTGFTGVTTRQLDEALARARADGATGLVLDLRGNGGGSVTAAQEMIGRFVPATLGPALYETVGRAGDSDDVQSLPVLNPVDGIVSDLPLVVLVDAGTASASEIVAASLSDYGRATVMGTPTFGKGSVQRVHTFEDESILRVTIAEWLTPDRQRLEGVGVAVGVVVGAGEPDGTDDQLTAAIALLRSGGTSAADFGW